MLLFIFYYFVLGTEVLKLWDDFFIIIVIIQTTDLNRSRSPWSTSQSYFIINILPQGVILTLLPLQIHLFPFSHHPSLLKTLLFNLLKDSPLWLIIPEKTFHSRYENAYKINLHMPPWQQTAISWPFCYFLGQQKHKIKDLEMLMLYYYCRGSRGFTNYTSQKTKCFLFLSISINFCYYHFNTELNIWGLDVTFI